MNTSRSLYGIHPNRHATELTPKLTVLICSFILSPPEVFESNYNICIPYTEKDENLRNTPDTNLVKLSQVFPKLITRMGRQNAINLIPTGHNIYDVFVGI